MRLSFRLAQLHNYTPDPHRRPGVIKAICENTGLDRHQVASLLKNEVKHVPLDALSRICDYLIRQGIATAEMLPGALFAVEAEHFWELLARRRKLDLCLGVRCGENASWMDGEWVVVSDSILMGELLNGMSSLGRLPPAETPPPALVDSPPGGAPAPKVVQALHPESIKQTLVWSPTPGHNDLSMERAVEAYDEFYDTDGDKALVCLGSMKSNPVAELVIASAFHLKPFETQDDRAEPGQRGCPLYIRYRPTDPHPNSCWGGLRLSRWEATDEPGIYYEQKDGQWAACPCAGKTQDAAYVFYVYREAQGWLEMALGGFSGRATRLLARTLMSRAESFWPPVECGSGVKAGAFIVKYTIQGDEDPAGNPLRNEPVAQTEIIRLDDEVLKLRVNPSRTKARRTSGVKAR